ncbi:hypothetical protein ACV229_35365 [Burkholderia sp. MR1-5-21]
MKNLTTIVAAMVACASIAGCANTSQSANENAMPNPGNPAAATCKADAAPDDALIGKSEAEAVAMLGGCAWRVSERDGQSLPGTMDYREDRRNLGINAGKVIWVRRG